MTAEEKKARKNAKDRERWHARLSDPEFAVAFRAADSARRKATRGDAIREREMRHYLKNKDRINAKRSVKYRALSDSERLFKFAKGRAAAKKLTFTITTADIVVPEFCPVLGIPLARHKGTPRPHSPSLDRIDPTKGYVPGNVQVLSQRANAIKNDATLEELEALVTHLRRKRQDPTALKPPANTTQPPTS